MKTTFTLLIVLLSAATIALSFAVDDTFQGAVIKPPFDAMVHGKPAKTSSTQMLYHGGPVMVNTNSVYVIYYGTFPSTTQPIINNFLSSLSGSAQYGVNETYGYPGGATVSGTYQFTPPGNPHSSVYLDNYSEGKQLGTNDIPKIVAHGISAGLGPDENGVYLVVTAPDVKISGFCTSFCAYHTTSTSIYSGLHIRYALIPEPTQRCTSCNGGIAIYGDTTTPNGDMGADTMTDDIMHELSETVTDPDLNAWYTKNGAENGDLCNYVYGTASVAANGAHYNATVGGYNYLIQLIWENDGAGYCAVQ